MDNNQITFDEELAQIEAQLKARVETGQEATLTEFEQTDTVRTEGTDHNGVLSEPKPSIGIKIQSSRQKPDLSNPTDEESISPLAEKEPAQNISLTSEEAIENLAPSAVDGMSQEDLNLLKAESRAAFSTGVAEVELTPEANLITKANGKRVIVLDFGKNLSPAEIGSFGLNRDISKSLKNPDDGIRDFFNVSYDEESKLRIIDKENYLNIPLTGDPSAALSRLADFEQKNKFNTNSLRNLHDATHTNMVKTHEKEREESRNNPEVIKRHKIETALWTYREQAQLHPDEQTTVHNFSALMKLHEARKIEEKGGRTVHEARRSPFEKEAAKFAAEPSPNRINTLTNKISAVRAPLQ